MLTIHTLSIILKPVIIKGVEMANKLEELVEQFKDEAPKIVKNNKGALIGAVIGYLLTDSKKAQSAILGLIAGSVIVDKNKDEE